MEYDFNNIYDFQYSNSDDIEKLAKIIKTIDEEELKIILLALFHSAEKDTGFMEDYGKVLCLICCCLPDVEENYMVLKSPIERKLYIALKMLLFLNNKSAGVYLKHIFVFDDYTYRADLFVDYWSGKGLIIECDGHFYHKNTPHQAVKDNEQDYSFKINGYDVLRFNGTQINKNPLKCATDILDFLNERDKNIQVFYKEGKDNG